MGANCPARPLILEAAGVPPNDPTNSHQAVKILKDWGFDVRYKGEVTPDEGKNQSQSDVQDLIRRLRGSCKGADSLVEAREHERRMEK